AFFHTPAELTVRASFKLTAFGIGSFLVYVRDLVGAGIHVAGMTAAMVYEDWVIRRGQVEVVLGKSPALGCLRVVVHKADHPLSGRRLRGTVADGSLNRGNRAQVTVDFL